MIKSSDRSGWFGASDTAIIMGNWKTKTFARWWAEKLGLIKNTYTSTAMITGTMYEPRILDHLGIEKRDRQIKLRSLRLRVNLDGEDLDAIVEVKTTGGEYRVSKAHWQQVQVQMYASGKKARIVAYKLDPDDYKNYFNPIDPMRLASHEIEYDREWLESKFLPRLRYLSACLKRGVFPSECDITV